MPPAARRASESAALARLVREQRSALVRSIMGVTGLGRHDAEDVLSVVTLRVLLNGVTTEPECWFRYVHDAARNEASNSRRSDRRRATRQAAATLPGTTDPHVDAITARIVFLDVMQALDELPEVERQIIRLHYFGDLTYGEIADQLGLNHSGVDSRIRQARGRLRSIMAERESDNLYGAMLAALGASIAARMAAAARRPSTLAPTTVAVAGVAALSMVGAVVGVPAPQVSHVESPHVGAMNRPRRGTLTPGHGDAAARGRDAANPPETAAFPVAAAPAPRPGTRSRLGPLAGLPTPTPSACAGTTCVGSHGDLPGDTITIRRLQAPLMQNVTPVCWLIPDNPEVSCSSDDDPDAYTVPRPTGPPQQARRDANGKSFPSAPDDREPSKGMPG